MENKKINPVEELSQLLHIPISTAQKIKDWIDIKELTTNKQIEELETTNQKLQRDYNAEKSTCQQLVEHTQHLQSQLADKNKEIGSYQSLIEDASKEVVKLQSELKEKDDLLYKRTIDSLELQSELNKINGKHVTEITSRNKRINDLEAEISTQQELNKTLLESTSFVNNALVESQLELANIKQNHKRDVEDCFKWILKQAALNNLKMYDDEFVVFKACTAIGKKLSASEIYDYYKQDHEKK